MSGTRGRRAIFGPKAVRVQGLLSKDGGTAFEAARASLAAAMGVRPEAVSDGDTIDLLARASLDVSLKAVQKIVKAATQP